VDAVKETAEREQVVIVSHAGGIPLAGRPDLLRVLISASFETRARRVAEATGISSPPAGPLSGVGRRR
jgi:cytidylate kinase